MTLTPEHSSTAPTVGPAASVPDHAAGPGGAAGDTDLTSGPLTVGEGVELTITGAHAGSVEVQGTLSIAGRLDGALTVASLGTVIVSGDVVGPVDVRVAGTLVIEASGRIAGPLHSNGSVTNHGWRSGHVEGRTPDDREGSTVMAALHGGDRYPGLPARA